MFITGDMHGFYDFYKLEEFAESEQGKNLTKKDYVTICGDFGGIWNWCLTGNSVPSNPKDVRWTIEELEQKHKIEEFPCTTLFLDGNHEKFSRLNSYPVEMWNGGKVHKISDSIIHLMRGQVYEIEGSTIFTFGGAASHDRGPATGTQLFDHGVSWWPEEICSQAERDEAVRNLAEHGNKVDYILTHCLSDAQMMKMGFADFNRTSNFLWNVEEQVEFKYWYCGHYHRDEWISPKIRILYRDIVELGKEEDENNTGTP